MSDRPVSIDRLIDDVARSMSAAETPALRARVVANLGRQRRGVSGLLMPAAMFASAAALAVAALWMPSHSLRESDSRNGVPHATVARVNTPPPAQPAKHESPVTPAKATQRETDDADDGPTIAALPSIEAMPVSDIQPKPLGVPQLSVEHVANVAPLSVAALDEIDRDR